jgi:hypothetical protein
MITLLSIVIAWIYSHVLEYFGHRFLHRFKKRNQLLSFHMREHHVNAKRRVMKDEPSGRETFYLGLLAIVHAPLLFVFPAAFITLLACSCSYLYVHNKCHKEPLWAARHYPWHVRHHLQNQQAHWGVRSNAIDILLGTDR